MLTRQKELVTKRLVLKSIFESAKEDMISLLCNSQISKTYILPIFDSEKAKEELFYRLKNASEDINRFVYGIYLNDRIIGFLNECGSEGEAIEIGYFINPNLWNNGYATEAFQSAIKELFRMGYKEVIAAHFVENLASGRVMQKCGMKKISKVGSIEYRSEVKDLIYYSINNY